MKNKEKYAKEIVDIACDGYSQALVDVRNILRGESQNDEGVEDNKRQ
mgnify:CR=1 FL=1